MRAVLASRAWPRSVAALLLLSVLGIAGAASATGAVSPDTDPPSAGEARARSDAETRAQSRSAYGNQTAERALETVRQKHPGLLPPPWRALENSPHPVDAYIGD